MRWPVEAVTTMMTPHTPLGDIWWLMVTRKGCLPGADDDRVTLCLGWLSGVWCLMRWLWWPVWSYGVDGWWLQPCVVTRQLDDRTGGWMVNQKVFVSLCKVMMMVVVISNVWWYDSYFKKKNSLSCSGEFIASMMKKKSKKVHEYKLRKLTKYQISLLGSRWLMVQVWTHCSGWLENKETKKLAHQVELKRSNTNDK